MTTNGLAPETLAAQALGEVDNASGALSPAIHPSTIYERSPDGSYKSGLAYTRADNPTYDHAERLLAALEGGAACMLFASGSAAATAIFQSLLPGREKPSFTGTASTRRPTSSRSRYCRSGHRGA